MLSCALLVLLVTPIGGSSARTASIPASYQYFLPSPFHGNLSEDFVSGMQCAQSSVKSALNNPQRAAFISYDKEFDRIMGKESSIQIVSRGTYGYAYEAGVWVCDLNQVGDWSDSRGGKWLINHRCGLRRQSRLDQPTYQFWT
jgi:hypothetical protein